MNTLTKKDIKREEELNAELEAILRKKEAVANKEREAEILRKFKHRPVCAVLGRGHSEGSLVDLGVSVSIPGNSGVTYRGPMVTQTVRTYFHNVWSDDMRSQFQKRLNDFVKAELDMVIGSPAVRIELFGLSSTYNMEVSKKTQRAIDTEVKEGRFAVLDTLDTSKMDKLSDFALSHGRSLWSEYKAAGGKNRKPTNQ